MRLDHLLSKEKEVEEVEFYCLIMRVLRPRTFGGDALRGNTRTHPEHDG